MGLPVGECKPAGSDGGPAVGAGPPGAAAGAWGRTGADCGADWAAAGDAGAGAGAVGAAAAGAIGVAGWGAVGVERIGGRDGIGGRGGGVSAISASSAVTSAPGDRVAVVVEAAPAGSAAFFFPAAFFGGSGSSGCTSRLSPSRSAFLRTRSACASSMLEEWLLTPMPSASQRSSVSLLVSPSSRASSYTLIRAATSPFFPSTRRSLNP